MRYWCCAPTWFSLYGGRQGDKGPEESWTERWSELLDDEYADGGVAVPDEFTVPPAAVCRSECDEMIVSIDGGVQFSCRPKHSEVVILTQELDHALIQS